MSLDLGSLEDLPQEYRDELTSLNLVPLWPSMRAVLPYNIPTRRTQALCWQYEAVLPLLMRAGELTPMEKAERRVLVLANPGHGLENMQVSPSIYMGIQLVLPGETAPNHRHTPNAVRIIIEGEGAFTTVDGEQCRMERGDLILTPAGKWHEHHQEGDTPIIWLDILDLPLIYNLEGSWAVEGQPQQNARVDDKSLAEYSAAGVVPFVDETPAPTDTPQLRYPWSKTRACLVAMSEQLDKGLLAIRYTNPETGRSPFPSIGFGALMLRPGETISLANRTYPRALHIVEGSGTLQVGDGKVLSFTEKDTLSAPGYSDIALSNSSDNSPLFLITADESPLHNYLGIY